MSHSNSRRRVLLISHDTMGKQMAGPGIRYYHLATVLARHADLTLAIPRMPGQSLAGIDVGVGATAFPVVPYVRGVWPTIEPLVGHADVIVLPSDTAADFPQLADQPAALVVDGYDPLMAEWLALHGAAEVEREGRHWRLRMQALYHQFLIGDFFLCASERQRDWWLGLLEAHGRINPWTFSDDPSLRRLIDVVAYGLPDRPPRHTRPMIKGVWPGIEPEDRLILWGGGLWLWLDPLTAIRAVARVWQKRQDVRLVFPGTRHPNPMLAEIGTHVQPARALAAELGLVDRAVFFGDWVPYEDWPNVLLESDVALSLHFDTLETRLAFRSRVLEYIWAGRPMVVSRGDATSQLVEQYGLGCVVECGDVEAVAHAIGRLLSCSDGLDAAFDRARHDLQWEEVARPLIDFCRQPRRAPDRAALGADLGNPTWTAQRRRLTRQTEELTQGIERLRAENERQRDLISRYEQGRFMRLMRWFYRLRRRLELA